MKENTTFGLYGTYWWAIVIDSLSEEIKVAPKGRPLRSGLNSEEDLYLCTCEDINLIEKLYGERIAALNVYYSIGRGLYIAIQSPKVNEKVLLIGPQWSVESFIFESLRPFSFLSLFINQFDVPSPVLRRIKQKEKRVGEIREHGTCIPLMSKEELKNLARNISQEIGELNSLESEISKVYGEYYDFITLLLEKADTDYPALVLFGDCIRYEFESFREKYKHTMDEISEMRIMLEDLLSRVNDQISLIQTDENAYIALCVAILSIIIDHLLKYCQLSHFHGHMQCSL